MAQYIKQGNIFGRLGAGIGQGLSEQLPKEVERGRLAAGLKQFEQDHQSLNPMQQLARLSGIPGITPQMVQSFSELARIQNQRNAYGNRGGQPIPAQEGRSSPDLSEVKQANLLDQAASVGMPMQSEFNPKANPSPKQTEQNRQQGDENARFPLQRSEAIPPGQAQLANYNPADPKALPRIPWTPEQRDARVFDYLQLGFLPDQAEQKAKNDEDRYLAEPGVIEQQQAQKDARQQKAETKLTEYVESRTQKKGTEVYNDITGDMLTDMKRAMSRYLVEHPNASADDVADEFSKRALNMAKTKNEVRTEAGKNGWENIFKPDFLLNKLRSYQKDFADAGNQEEYFNMLKSSPEKGGFELSPQGAAVIAFPASPGLKSYISSYKPQGVKYETANGSVAGAKKAALEISKHMGDDDSPLAVARMLSEKDPFFNQRAFFEQLTDNLDDLRFNARQRREVSMGERELLPTWGDIKVFPAFRRSTK